MQEIQTLQQAVQTVSAQTHSLSLNERARSKDFQAYYKMTIDSKRVLSELNTNISNYLKNIEIKTSNLLFNLEYRQNTTEADMSSKFQAVMALNTNTKNQLENLEVKTNEQLFRIEQIQNSTSARIEAMKTSDNLTMTTMVQNQINNNEERVAMTAYPSSAGTITDTIMKFDDVRFSEGIKNLGAYKNTGKFTCELEGVYLIIASVLSYISGASYKISLNGNFILETHIGDHSGNFAYTGTVTITRKLNPNDQVLLYAPESWYLNSGLLSKLTISKIK